MLLLNVEVPKAGICERFENFHVSTQGGDFSWNFSLRISARSWDLDASIIQLRDSVRKIGEQFVLLKNIAERTDRRIQKHLAAICPEALRGISPLEAGTHGKCRCMNETDSKVPRLGSIYRNTARDEA